MMTGPFLRAHNGGSGWCVADLMTQTPVTAAAEEPLGDAVVRMAESRIDRLPVLDEHGRPIGIVAREDVVRVLARAVRASRGLSRTTRAPSATSRPYLLPD